MRGRGRASVAAGPDTLLGTGVAQRMILRY